MVDSEALFDRVLEFPDPEAERRFDGLVGIDEIKARLLQEARSLLDPAVLETWSKAHYGTVLPIVTEVMSRTPLVVLAGDVGTGKTELAESFPHMVARELGIGLTLYPLSLSARGRGRVGEMTTLITAAFAAVTKAAQGGRDSGGNLRSGVVLLIDEGDALAQSRDLDQMHHEDRAGVNALIRGIDGLRRDRLPVLVIISTNRESALDPAVLRRAAAILHFRRPDDAQRREVVSQALRGAGISEAEIDAVVRVTGPTDGRAYGCTFSDLRQRFLIGVVLDSLEKGPLTGDRLVALAGQFVPTPPFGETDV